MTGFVDRAERLGFDSVWTLDRLVYGGLASLPLLAWAAGQTERVTLGTSIVLGTLRSPLVLAKECATLDVLSEGRFILGMGMGNRADDYEAAGVPMARRGARMTDTVNLMRRAWSGQAVEYTGKVLSPKVGPVGPRPFSPAGPPIWLGGPTPGALRRAARLADGYVAGGGGPASAHTAVPAARQAAQEMGRDLSAFPCSALVYFSVSGDMDRDVANVTTFLEQYYGRAIFDPRQSAVVGPADRAADRIREYADLDLHTLIIVAVTTDATQVERLAEAVQRVRAT
jgi:alkanesulfonate monooxygenase SsuD/methylene tetrahydromethanopterin reductase-like flavin-dependent oxidoreductase (luciferase family)